MNGFGFENSYLDKAPRDCSPRNKRSFIRLVTGSLVNIELMQKMFVF